MDAIRFPPNRVRPQVARIVAYLLALGLGGLPLAARPIGYPSSRDGIKVEITPSPHGVAVVATVANRGRVNAYLIHGGLLGVWRLFVFDAAGRLVHSTSVAHLHMPPRISPHTLNPGMAADKRFDLSRYLHGAGRATFYVYVERYVGVQSGKNTGFFILRSPVLRASICRGAPPLWKVVAAVPIPGMKARPNRAAVAAPAFPRYKIPTTGPIATLAAMAKATHARDISAVRRLCFNGHHAAEPFYIALAARAVAARRCISVVKNRFGIDPWPRVVPSPDVFSHILRQLDPRAVHIHGETATVGVLWFDGGKFKPFPSFSYHFRKIHGRWLLDSWATQESAPRASARSYRLNVENSLREAGVFNSLARDLAAGKFANIHAFQAAARRRMAAISDWFMVQSLKNNKAWMKTNAWLVKKVDAQEKAAKNRAAQTRP